MVDAAGSVFGFHVRSPFELRLVRAGGGCEPLDVVPSPEPATRPLTSPLCEWRLRGHPEGATVRLYACRRGLELWTPGGTVFRIDPPRRSIEVARRGDEVLWEAGLWGIPALLCFTERGDLPLHAAAVEVGGGAVLLAAPGGFGKTTLALAFQQLGYRVLSEDLVCYRLTPHPVLLPGPAVLRMRRDMVIGHAPPGTHLLGTRNERVYLALDAGQRGTGDPVPIRALVLLQPSTNGTRLERATGPRLLNRLWELTFRLADDGVAARSFQQLATLAGRVPIWQLHHRMRLASLGETVSRIVESCSEEAPA